MARTHKKNWRVYVSGYDMSGYSFGIGPLSNEYEEVGETAFSDGVHGKYCGQATNSIGTLNTVFDNTASIGSHTVLSSVAKRIVTVAIGDTNAPAAGDPTFNGEFEQTGYLGTGEGMITATVPFAPSSEATTLLYPRAFGVLLHASGAETGANTGTSDHDHGAQTTYGGYGVFHLISSDGTCTLSIDDASTDTNPSFSSLLSAAEMDASSAPKYEIEALATNATVERYLRWQIALNTATTATFVISFVRSIRENY